MQPQIQNDSDDNRLIDLFRENPGKELLTDLWIIQDLRKAGASGTSRKKSRGKVSPRRQWEMSSVRSVLPAPGQRGKMGTGQP